MRLPRQPYLGPNYIDFAIVFKSRDERQRLKIKTSISIVALL